MAAQPFPVVQVLRSALARVVEQRRAVLRALLLPGLALAAGEALSEEDLGGSAGSFVLGVLLAAFIATGAVSCHRIFLLGEPSLPNRWGLFFTWRELRFAGWYAVASLMAMAVFAVVAVPLGIALVLALDALEASCDPVLPAGLLAITTLPGACYVLARASLVLPATAIDGRPTMARVWALSDGNGWRVAAALSPPLLLMLGIDAVSSRISPPGPVGSLVYALETLLVVASEAALLSASFRTLGGQAVATARSR